MKKELPEICKEINEIMYQQFGVYRKNDSYIQTLEEIINLMLNLFAGNMIAITQPDKRLEMFDEQFPSICQGLEIAYKQFVKNHEKDCECCADLR